MTPDLFEGLEVLKWALINNPEKDAYLKANLLNDVYVVMKMFLDMLSGMLPCREVDDLRNAYMSFHSARDNGEAFRCARPPLRDRGTRLGAQARTVALQGTHAPRRRHRQLQGRRRTRHGGEQEETAPRTNRQRPQGS